MPSHHDESPEQADGEHHYDVDLDLADPDSLLTGLVVELCGPTNAPSAGEVGQE